MSTVYKVTSTAVHDTTGETVTAEAYVARGRLQDRINVRYGDYRAIGNSLMEDIDHDDYGIREILLSQSSATIELAGQPVEVTQTTQYPWEPSIQFTVSPASPATFALKLRVPGWSRDATVSVNGKEIDTQRFR